MSEFFNRLESVRNKAVEVTNKLIEFTYAVDDFYSYCFEVHEAKAKREGRPVQTSELPQTKKHPLRSAYQECD